jgi:hypothetical protein
LSLGAQPGNPRIFKPSLSRDEKELLTDRRDTAENREPVLRSDVRLDKGRNRHDSAASVRRELHERPILEDAPDTRLDTVYFKPSIELEPHR